MFPVHPTNITVALPSTPPSLHSPSRHGRKLSHVQFGKRPYNLQDEYASSAFTMYFDEHLKKQSITPDSTIQLTNIKTTEPVVEKGVEVEEEEARLIVGGPISYRKRFIEWFYSRHNLGPFTKGQDQYWALFTYLMVGIALIMFSGELLLSKQSSGEFFELEPFNYMLGPSMEIMIQSGARFPPCMRKVDSMPSDQRYICLHTITQSNLTPIAISHTNTTTITNPSAEFNHTTTAIQQQPTLMLLDPVVDITDPRLLNSTCSLSTICGMTTFHQYRVPDQTYRLLSPLFIHTGLVHLSINIALLIMLGARIEKKINTLRFACTYEIFHVIYDELIRFLYLTVLFLGSGVFGHALGANLSPPTTPFLGCSSSLFGLVGFLYVDLILNWKELEKPVSFLMKLMVCTGLMFAIGILPGVDTFSHLGGLFSGFLMSLFLLPVTWWTHSLMRARSRYILIIFLRIFCVCLFGLLLALLVHLFSISKLDQVCPYCRYISCLPINGFCD